MSTNLVTYPDRREEATECTVADGISTVEAGKTYLTHVRGITDYGVFVEIVPSRDPANQVHALVHREDLPVHCSLRDLAAGDKLIVRPTEINKTERELQAEPVAIKSGGVSSKTGAIVKQTNGNWKRVD